MALILTIDTAMENAGICIANDAEVLSLQTNSRQMDHAKWMHTAIREVLREANKDVSELKAVAVTSGPGSYTGLRVGMAAAKGLCYVLNIPLITESTLLLIAAGVKKNINKEAWICPMIDARRMEVFTVLYDHQMKVQQEASAMILEEHSFHHVLDQHPVVFAGNGSVKWHTVCHHANAIFSPASYTMSDLASHFASKCKAEDFTDIAYSEPSYLKNVYMGTKDE